MTPEAADAVLPRPDYPRPQWVRRDWLCLNGIWDFEIDQGDSGLERGLLHKRLADRILVPFAPESEMSGVANVDFLEAVWYRRVVRIPSSWAGRKVLVHFGAVDYDSTVWVDGSEVKRHRGGYTPFTAEVPPGSGPKGEIDLVLRARDSRHQLQARGKQSSDYAGSGSRYARTTGIWQTVWLEPVPELHMGRPRITPVVGDASFHIEVPLSANRSGHRVRVVLTERFDFEQLSAVGRELAVETVAADLDLQALLTLWVPAMEARTWSPADPHLFGLRFELVDPNGRIVDSADSYAGLRGMAIDGDRVLLNGQSTFQRLVLDQGLWPESLLTAPSDNALVKDIELGIAAGFNGARVHQRVPEERYLFHADRLGYLVWSEFPDWGAFDLAEADGRGTAAASLVAQWLEVLDRDHNHPSIVGWCPLNETAQPLQDRVTLLDDVTRALFLATKSSDASRPALDASGHSHRVSNSDIWDSHCYEQDPVRFAEQQSGIREGRPYTNKGSSGENWSLEYSGQPYFVSEFGGIWWDPGAPDSTGADGWKSWGYGLRVVDEEDFYQRFAGLVEVLLDSPNMFGYCYTQLCDTFQEKNGIYRADRTTKLDVGRIRALQQRAAASESANLDDMPSRIRASDEARN